MKENNPWHPGNDCIEPMIDALLQFHNGMTKAAKEWLLGRGLSPSVEFRYAVDRDSLLTPGRIEFLRCYLQFNRLDSMGNEIAARFQGILSLLDSFESEAARPKSQEIIRTRPDEDLGRIVSDVALEVFNECYDRIDGLREYLRQLNWMIRNKHELPPQIIDEEPPMGAKPMWNEDHLELSLGGIVIRKIVGRAKNVLNVVETFNNAGWPDRIDNPLNDGEALREAVRSLNKGLKCIRFSSDGKPEDERGVIWKRMHTERT